MAEENVDAVVTGLVREYLYRKGLTEVLRIFDEETGARETSVNATSELVKQLHLVKLYRKNQTSDAPLPSVLEVLTSYFFKGVIPENDNSSSSSSSGTTDESLTVVSVSSSSSSTSIPTIVTKSTVTVPMTTNDNDQQNGTEESTVTTMISSDNPSSGTDTNTNISTTKTESSTAVKTVFTVDDHIGNNNNAIINTTVDPAIAVPPVPTDSSKTAIASTTDNVGGGFFARIAAHKATEATIMTDSATATLTTSTDDSSLRPPTVPSIPPIVPVMVSENTVAKPIIPSVPSIPSVTSSTTTVNSSTSTGTSFWDRINANKTATTDNNGTVLPSTASNVTPNAPAVPTVPAKSIPPTVPLPLSTSSTTETSSSSSTSGSGGGGFWDRINANKTIATTNTTVPPTSIPPTVSPSSTTPSIPDTAASSTGSTVSGNGGSFWSRINNNKTAAETGTTPSSLTSSTSSSSVTLSTPAPSVPITKSSASSSSSTGPVFTAPDGKTFTDRNQYRQYMFITFYTFSQRSNETLTKVPGDIGGQPFNIEDCTNCTIRLCDYSETVQVDRVQNCQIFIGACCESVFLRNISNCTVTLACKQLRTRDCSNCTIFLYSKTDPIIEASYSMRFAPFNGSYPGIEKHMKAANLDPKYNHWKRIFDFSKDNTALPVPHWEYLHTNEYKEWIINDLPGYENQPCMNPVPSDAAPRDEGTNGSSTTVGPSTTNSMLSFDIRSTSQSAAEAALGSQSNPSVPTATSTKKNSGNGGFFARLAASKTNAAINKYSA